MMSTVALVMMCALSLQTMTDAAKTAMLSLDASVQRQVATTVGDWQLDAAARVSQTFEAAPVKDVLAAIGRSTGLAVRFDQSVPESERSFTGRLTDLPLDAALAAVVTTNGMAFNVTSAKSVFVYSDTSANRQRFAESIRVFELAKASSGELIQTLTTQLIGPRRDGIRPMVVAVRTPSLIVVRATADKMDEIAKFIAANDKQ